MIAQTNGFFCYMLLHENMLFSCGCKEMDSQANDDMSAINGGDKDNALEQQRQKLEKQIIYYPHAEKIDLNNFEADIDTIDLSLSRLSQLESFAKFTNLRSICFRSNLLKSFERQHLRKESGLANIEELDFYDNQIETIENLDELTTLKALDLSFNRFRKIENLDTLINLRKIYFVHNQIGKLEHLDALTQLEILEAGDNQLREIENIDALRMLRELSVSFSFPFLFFSQCVVFLLIFLTIFVPLSIDIWAKTRSSAFRISTCRVWKYSACSRTV